MYIIYICFIKQIINKYSLYKKLLTKGANNDIKDLYFMA